MKHKVAFVESYEQACQVLQEAEEQGKSLVLQNAPGTHQSLGFMYIKEMMEQAVEKFSEVKTDLIFDAGNSAPVAIAAMRHGFSTVHFCGDDAVLEKLYDIAEEEGATILTTSEEK